MLSCKRRRSARPLSSLRLDLSPYLCQNFFYLAGLVVRLANLGPSFNFLPRVRPLANDDPNPDQDNESQASYADGGSRLKDGWQSQKANQKQDEERSNANLSCDPASLRLAVKLVSDLFQSSQHIAWVCHTPPPQVILWALVAANVKPKRTPDNFVPEKS
jgi:hypothetical protein